MIFGYIILFFRTGCAACQRTSLVNVYSDINAQELVIDFSKEKWYRKYSINPIFTQGGYNMDAPPWKVEFYQKDDKSEPAIDFLNSLNDKMNAKAVRALELLQKNGNELREPDSRKIKGPIYELRVKLSSNIIRFFYFFYYDKKIIITHGFQKKQQRTPKKEIEKAEKYYQDFLKRYGTKK